jgi:uncharacterized protein (TIGR03083 family)
MSNNADGVIAALRSGYESLAGLVSGLSDDDLASPSAATEWDVSQVLSHLGSGAEINQATLQAALDGQPNPGMDFARPVWARWDSAGRRERADGFLRENATLTSLFESLAPREELRIDMGFLPQPLDVATAARYRLTEFTLHSWDARAGLDPSAVLAPEAIGYLLPVVAQMAGMIGKPAALDGAKTVIRVTTTAPDSVLALRLGDQVSIDSSDAPDDPDGTLSLPAEAWVRLCTGRLGARYTPASVTVGGTTDLGLLRRVFPGF